MNTMTATGRQGRLRLTRGIPASGKTTWAKAQVAADPEHRRRISRDDLRMELFSCGGRLTRAQEEQVTEVQYRRVLDWLRDGLEVIVDDTNLGSNAVGTWQMLCADAEEHISCPVCVVDFRVDVQVAIERD